MCELTSVNDQNQLLHIVGQQPFIELRHDLRNVLVQQLIRTDEQSDAVFVYALERFARVQSTLENDAAYGVTKEFRHDCGGTTKGDLLSH